jgi:glutamate--cysteine ligase
VAIAKSGLKSRAHLNGGFLDETIYLGDLEEIAETGITPAERLLALYEGAWKGDISRVFEDFAY